MRPVIRIINPYDAGLFPEDLIRKGFDRGNVIQLASNENPYPLPEEVIEAIMKSVEVASRYPHPGYRELKERIAGYVGCSVENVVPAAGASELIKLVVDAVVEPFDRVIIPMPSYSYYVLASMLRDASIIFPEFEGYKIQPEVPYGKLIFLCSPNNPTGNMIERKVVEEIVESFNGYVVLDEAYVEFSGKSCVDMVESHDNLIVLRTFSKFFGLAGLRVGYAIASQEMASALEKIRSPFSISQTAYFAAIAVLKCIDYFMELKARILKERERLRKELSKFFQIYPSDANFLLCRHSFTELTAKLLEEGIIVRDVTGLMGLDGPHVRITVGREDENDRLIEAIKEICG
jgi:histidinol-phosphate aminotransferase